MYRTTQATGTSIRANESFQGESIEAKMRRIVQNNEPITDSAVLIYTERKEGVLPGYDIRTDRWEIALGAFEKIDKSSKAKREERHKTAEQKEADRLAKEAKNNMGKEGESNTSNN